MLWCLCIRRFMFCSANGSSKTVNSSTHQSPTNLAKIHRQNRDFWIPFHDSDHHHINIIPSPWHHRCIRLMLSVFVAMTGIFSLYFLHHVNWNVKVHWIEIGFVFALWRCNNNESQLNAQGTKTLQFVSIHLNRQISYLHESAMENVKVVEFHGKNPEINLYRRGNSIFHKTPTKKQTKLLSIFPYYIANFVSFSSQWIRRACNFTFN